MIFRRNQQPVIRPELIDDKNINAIVDFTLLSPTATVVDVENLCNIAQKNRYFSVCINPVNVAFARNYIDLKLKSSLKICTVVGFPLGENTTESKVFETKRAIADGADEIDMVLSISRVKAGNWDYVKNDISRVVRVSRGRVVKVIIETAYLTRDEIVQATKICMKARASFVKTSTGFAPGGATLEGVELISSVVKGRCGVKASGGIASRFDAVNMVRKGATRIGTSRII